jgi:hypothetical protein
LADELALGRDALLGESDRSADVLAVLHDVEQVAHVASEPVDLRHCQGVAKLDLIQELATLLQPVGLGSGDAFVGVPTDRMSSGRAYAARSMSALCRSREPDSSVATLILVNARTMPIPRTRPG